MQNMIVQIICCWIITFEIKNTEGGVLQCVFWFVVVLGHGLLKLLHPRIFQTIQFSVYLLICNYECYHIKT